MAEPIRKSSLLQSLAEKLHLTKPKYQIFLCVGPDCCTNEVGLNALKYLEERIKEAGLEHGEGRVQVTKTPCMKICGGGPVAIVYPGAIWYSNLTPGRIDRIVEDHFLADRPVEAFTFQPPIEARYPIKIEPT